MRGPIDWEAIRRRVAEAVSASAPDRARSTDEVGRILAERARALASVAVELAPPSESLAVVPFSRDGAEYAVEAGSVLEVVPLRRLTPLPHAPPAVLGLIAHRGEIVLVVDLCAFWRGQPADRPLPPIVVLIESGESKLGICADRVTGTALVNVDALAPLPTAMAGASQPFVRGVTGAMVAVLDLEALVGDPRIVVGDVGSRRAAPQMTDGRSPRTDPSGEQRP